MFELLSFKIKWFVCSLYTISAQFIISAHSIFIHKSSKNASSDSSLLLLLIFTKNNSVVIIFFYFKLKICTYQVVLISFARRLSERDQNYICWEDCVKPNETPKSNWGFFYSSKP